MEQGGLTSFPLTAQMYLQTEGAEEKEQTEESDREEGRSEDRQGMQSHGPWPDSKGTQAGDLWISVRLGAPSVGSIMNNSFKCQLFEWGGLRDLLQATIS